MNGEVASWLMHHLDNGELGIENAPDETKRWLEGLDLPMELLRFLQWNWPQNDCQIGPIAISKSASIPDQEGIKVLLEHKLIPVGYAPNGDTFVIDFSVESCPVGFINHEEYDSGGDPRPFLQLAARLVESFLYRVAEDRFFPCDYYVATDFNQFLRDEASHQQYPPYPPIDAQRAGGGNA